MKILAIANQKGGVGKSMLAVHLTWLALEQGQPVLLVDLDGQANSSHTFVDEFSGLTASMLFTIEPGSLTEVPQTISEQFSLISADTAVNDVEGLDLGTIERPIAHLRNLVQPSSEKDFTCEEVSHAKLLDPEILVIIDTPPTLGRRLIAALIAADAVVSPLTLNGYSVQGITDLLKTVKTVRRRFNPTIKNLGLLANMVNARSGTHRQMLAELKNTLGDKFLPFVLHNRVAISDAIDQRKPVWRGAKGQSSQSAAQEMRQVCMVILEQLQ